MAKGYRPVHRDQRFLLPVDMADWLPADHLIWFVLAAVQAIDTSAFHRQARTGGAGRAGYDPDLLLGLLLYAYAVGQRSSRRIEQACHTDVAYRIACAGDIPDHTVIARFRREHTDAFAALFEQVLLLCVRGGLGQFGSISLDGTKIAAAASIQANRTRDWLTTTVARILAEAETSDTADEAADTEAAQAGPRGAGRLADPDRLQALIEAINADSQARPDHTRRVAAAQKRLQANQQAAAQMRHTLQAKQRAYDQAAAAGQRPPGRRPKLDDHSWMRRAAARVATARQHLEHLSDPAQASKPRPANLTDPDSRLMPTRAGFIQGYNCQLAVADDYLILAAHACQDTGDAGQFPGMLERIDHAAALAGSTSAPPTPTPVGTILADAGYHSHTNLTAPGPDRLIATGKRHRLDKAAADPPAPPPADASASQRMAWRLATPDGIAAYRRRGATVEAVNGHLKDHRGLRRFAQRGLPAVQAELHLAAAVTNLCRLHTRARPAGGTRQPGRRPARRGGRATPPPARRTRPSTGRRPHHRKSNSLLCNLLCPRSARLGWAATLTYWRCA